MHVKVGADLLKAAALVKAVGGGSAGQQQQQGSQTPAAPPTPQQQDQQQDQQQEQQQEQQAEQPPQQQQAYQATAGPQPSEASQPPDTEPPEQRQQQLEAALGGEQLTALLGHPDATLCHAEIEDVTPACAGGSEAEQAEQDAINRGDKEVPAHKERRLALVRGGKGAQEGRKAGVRGQGFREQGHGVLQSLPSGHGIVLVALVNAQH